MWKSFFGYNVVFPQCHPLLKLPVFSPHLYVLDHDHVKWCFLWIAWSPWWCVMHTFLGTGEVVIFFDLIYYSLFHPLLNIRLYHSITLDPNSYGHLHLESWIESFHLSFCLIFQCIKCVNLCNITLLSYWMFLLAYLNLVKAG